MKKSINFLSAIKMTLVVVFLTACFSANSQAVVSVDKMNVLYRGLANPISVAVAGVDAKLVQLMATNAKLNKIDDIHYTIVPTGSSMEVSLRVFSVKGKDTIEHGSFGYRVMPLPSPEMRIAGVILDDEPTIPFAKLKANPYLIADLPNFVFDVKYKVTNFTITFSDGDINYSENINGGKITPEVLSKLAKLAKPTKILVSDIIVESPNGKLAVPTVSFMLGFAN